ncbi:Phosphodiesterase YfcE [bioreactor metagenome]|uniref:Phosphodiesterase YfcE n=1 Tax=bioreactor metagenome TaxID=1076179 RepID=A0A645HYP7_9ZZZZ
MDYARNLIANKRMIAVKGNCDFASQLSVFRLEIIEGKRFYVTHGYLENVKCSLSGLRAQAQKFCADIVLYGHTHQSVTEYDNGVYYFNPGSLRNGEYGVIDITKAGVVCIPMKLRY